MLWSNAGFIFDQIEIETAGNEIGFYDLARDKQWALIQKKVEEIIGELEEEYPEPELGQIDSNGDSNSDQNADTTAPVL